MPDLLVQSREHDLPPKWDGHPVEWDGWSEASDIFICPPPGDEPCHMCGSVRRGLITGGTVTADWPDGVAAIRQARLRERVTRWRLSVFRCPDCRHDTVWDMRTDQWWDLDHSDYGPDGSNAPEEASDA